MSEEPRKPLRPRRPDDPGLLGEIREALRGLEYGKLTVVVQDGVIVQFERTDRVRVNREA